MWYGLSIAEWSTFLECSEYNGINCWGNPCNLVVKQYVLGSIGVICDCIKPNFKICSRRRFVLMRMLVGPRCVQHIYIRWTSLQMM